MSSAAAIPAIEVEGLTKRFGEQLADDAVSFRVHPGETYGLLGPNGAGKTTLIRMLTTLVPPTGGSARIEGRDVVTEKGAVRRLIGTVSQAQTTDEDLTVLGIRDDGRRRARALGILDDLRLAVLHDGDTGVGRPEVDADCLSHGSCPYSALHVRRHYHYSFPSGAPKLTTSLGFAR